MASELQRLVDNRGHRLGRSVATDDRNIRLLAYCQFPKSTAQLTEVDCTWSGGKIG